MGFHVMDLCTAPSNTFWEWFAHNPCTPFRGGCGLPHATPFSKRAEHNPQTSSPSEGVSRKPPFHRGCAQPFATLMQ